MNSNTFQHTSHTLRPLKEKYEECCTTLHVLADAKKEQIRVLSEKVEDQFPLSCNFQLLAIEANIDNVKRNKARAERELRSRTDDIVARLDASATRMYLSLLGGTSIFS